MFDYMARSIYIHIYIYREREMHISESRADSFVNVNIYNSGRTAALLSTNGALFKLLFTHPEEHPALQLQLLWVPSHLDDPEKLRR